MIILPFINSSNIDNASVAGMRLSSKYGINDSAFVIHDYKIRVGKIVGIDGLVQLDGSCQ